MKIRIFYYRIVFCFSISCIFNLFTKFLQSTVYRVHNCACLSGEWIVINSGLRKPIFLFFTFAHLYQSFDVFAIGRCLHFLFQCAFMRFIRIDWVNYASNDINIEFTFFFQITQRRWWYIECVNESICLTIRFTIHTDFIWQSTKSQIVQFTNDTALLEYYFGSSLHCAKQFWLKWYDEVMFSGVVQRSRRIQST